MAFATHDRKADRERGSVSNGVPKTRLRRGCLVAGPVDFTDDAAWAALVVDANKPYGPDGFSAYFSAISDGVFDGKSAEDLARFDGDAWVVFAADRSSMVGDERTLIVVGRHDDAGRSFRVVLREAWGPENNLRLANMDCTDFYRATDPDGVFRGFAV